MGLKDVNPGAAGMALPPPNDGGYIFPSPFCISEYKSTFAVQNFLAECLQYNS